MSKILIDEATVKLALEALRSMANTLAEHQEPTTFYEDEAMRALKALAEQPAQQEPVAWMQDSIELYVQDRPGASYTIPLYTTPQAQPAREWVGLTPEESVALFERHGHRTGELVGAVEDKLKEKNT